MYRRFGRSLFVLCLAIALAGCGVSQDEHDEVLTQLEDSQVAKAQLEADKADLEERLTNEIEVLNERIEELRDEQASLEQELEQARGDLELYEDRKGSLEDTLEANRAELDELREARRQTEERMEVYRDLARQLASMIEAGQLSVTVRNGRMVINLANDILFASGRTDIRQEGQDALADLAEILEDIDDRELLIAGHTDDIPISSARFDSNWHLSTSRAIEVVQHLIDQGVNPTNLVAAGYGEYDPIASNDTDEGRAQNRRIEIVLMPSIDELPSMPDEWDDDATADDQS